MSQYLIDTDLIIDHLRGWRSISDVFHQYFPHDLHPDARISKITILELLMHDSANYPEKRAKILEIQNFVTTIGVDWHIEAAAQIIRDRRLKEQRLRYKFIPDSIIAATAMNQNLILVSRNKRDFDWLGDKLNAQFV
ncbi:MAG: PIN domain-containing protein [Patescibacteria group bacterium]